MFFRNFNTYQDAQEYDDIWRIVLTLVISSIGAGVACLMWIFEHVGVTP